LPIKEKTGKLDVVFANTGIYQQVPCDQAALGADVVPRTRREGEDTW